MRVSLPGIGGNLGECVLCGECFALELILGRDVSMIHISGFDQELPFHQKCAEKLEGLRGKNWDAFA